jgi:uncharacterized protein YeaO (DUF488 family)
MPRRKLQLHTFRMGTEREKREGLRIATTRRPPRGVKKADWSTRAHFDVWFPVVAPSESLLRRAKELLKTPEKFFASYEREVLGHAESRQAIELLAALARRTPISIGCFCEDEAHCHRTRLRELIERAAKCE